MSESWKRRLVRDADGRPVYASLHGNPYALDVGVVQFRGDVIPVGYVAFILKKSEKTVQRMIDKKWIPGTFKTRGGHRRIRQCPDAWNWLNEQWRLRERGEAWSQAQTWRELHSSVQLMIALEEIVAKRQQCPERELTPRDLDDTYKRAYQLMEHRYGVLLEKLPKTISQRVRRRTRTEWEIGWKVMEWLLTGSMPETGDEAGRRIWGDDSWEQYQIGRRREFVAIFRRWKKQLQDDSWLPDKSDDESQYGVKISNRSLLGEHPGDEDEWR